MPYESDRRARLYADPFVHRGSVLEARFRSDGSVNDWGYLFTVRAFFPEKSSSDIQSFPHIAYILKSAIESIVFDLFIGAGFACDRTVWSYVLWNVFKEAEYNVFYLPWSNTGTY